MFPFLIILAPYHYIFIFFYHKTDDQNNGKLGGKKKKKSKKSKRGNNKKSKRGRGKGKKKGSTKKKKDNRFTMYLAQQMLKITKEEAVIPTKALKWSEFRSWLKQNMYYSHQHPNRAEQARIFKKKVGKLLEYCTKIKLSLEGVEKIDDVSTYYCLWLQIPQKEKWIQLIINDGDWFTNCTSEETMMSFTTPVGSKHYWFFRIIENQSSANNTILLLRADKGGICGELVWLQKGTNVSGTDALAIENAISEALDLKWTYLHDDSKINVPGNSTRSHNCLYLKTLRSIAKGKSWYAQALYAPFSCTKWPSQSNVNQTGVEQGTVFTQDAKQYRSAITYIRFLTMKDVRKLFINNTNWDAINHKKGSLSMNKKSKSTRKTRRNKNKNQEDIDDEDKVPPLLPSDIKELDDIFQNMNTYDPYYTKYGEPKRMTYNDDESSDNLINPRYFFSFSDDDDYNSILEETDNDKDKDNDNDEDMESVNSNTNSVKIELPKKRKRGRPRKHPLPEPKRRRLSETFSSLTRQTRSRSKKDPLEFKREKLRENSKKCSVGRWRRKRVKIRSSKNMAFEYIMKNEWDDNELNYDEIKPKSEPNNNDNTNTKDSDPKNISMKNGRR